MSPLSETHPWISFQLDLRKADPESWMMLGEAESKCEHIAGVPLRPGVAKQFYQGYLAKGALATTAIEGNSLTEADARKIVEGKLEVPKSKEYLKQEIENIVKACEAILSERPTSMGALSVDLLCEFNRGVLENIPVENHVIPGKIRTIDVGVAKYKAPPHGECAQFLQHLCDWLNSADLRGDDEHQIAYALIRAIAAHVYIAWIHPFGDGNGRTARLVEYFVLVNAGVPLPSAHLLSNHYNHTRTEYYRQLTASSASGGEIMPLIKYALQGFVDGLKEQLGVIRVQQWDVAWVNYVHDSFRDKNSAADVRRRHVVLDLRQKDVTGAELRTLSPRVAAAYSRKQDKTISRDINALLKMGLIQKKGNRIRAYRDRILAFLPPRKTSPSTTKPKERELASP